MLFDRLLNGAFWFAIALICGSICLMLIVLWLHARNLRRHRRVDSMMTTWNAALERTWRGEACCIPVAEKQNAVEMLQMWCDAWETSSRSENAKLLMPQVWSVVTRRAGLDRLARELLKHGDAPEQVVGARLLGFLGDSSAKSRLKALCSDEDCDVSLAAAMALLRIDPSFAGAFVERLLTRSDWIAPHVERIVCENARAFGANFVIAVRDADAARMRRILEVVPLLGHDVVRAVATYALEKPRHDVENVPAALRALRLFVDPADIPLLQRLAEDPIAEVRAQAVNALGEVDHPRAEALLVARLNDPDSWVRRRAAEALARRHVV